MFEDALRSAMGVALESEIRAAVDFYKEPTNSRNYPCGNAGCERKGYAGGYCNVHYMRNRSGAEMNAPIRIRKRDGLCSTCGKQSGAKGGWGMCQKHYRQRRYAVIKNALVKAMGGECAKCHGVFPLSVFDFHHIGVKIDSPSTMMINLSIDDIAKELSKCSLLCANCHRMEHHDAGDDNV